LKNSIKLKPADKSGMLARILLCSSFCAIAFAQDPDIPPPTAKPFQFTGAVDAFYSGNLNHPASGVNQVQNFDTHDGWALDFASLSVQANGAKFGFRLDTGFGEMYKTMNLADTWAGPNRYISQAYVSYKPIRNSALEIDAGKFFTSAGAEVPESYNNFNYSRSLLYVLGEPYYHFGLRSTIPITKSFSIGAQFLDGCNNLGNLQGGKMLGLVAAVTRSKMELDAYLSHWTGIHRPARSGSPLSRQRSHVHAAPLDQLLFRSPAFDRALVDWWQRLVVRLGGRS
jgi:hypothetical protein